MENKGLVPFHGFSQKCPWLANAQAGLMRQLIHYHQTVYIVFTLCTYTGPLVLSPQQRGQVLAARFASFSTRMYLGAFTCFVSLDIMTSEPQFLLLSELCPLIPSPQPLGGFPQGLAISKRPDISSKSNLLVSNTSLVPQWVPLKGLTLT